jgi:hypothetical protein
VFGAAVSIVNARLATEASTLPAASVARTSKVRAPSASAAGVYGDVHAVKDAASMRHWNVALASGEEKLKVGVLSAVGPTGPAVMVVSGGIVSTVKLRLDAVWSMIPTWSIALTSKVCGPSLSTPVVSGDVHDVNAAVSTRQANVETDSDDVKLKVGVASVVSPAGPTVIVVSGGVRSMMMLRVAGVVSAFDARSTARTWNV